MTVQYSCWDAFNPYAYVVDNYQTIHDEDRLILDSILPLIQQECSRSCRVLDIGTGPNLYPIIALFPYSRHIDCLEYSRSNVKYLRDQIHNPSECWHRFHRYMQRYSDRYLFPLQRTLSDKVFIRRGDLFSEIFAGYDVVTMFFCAESITSRRDTFVAACIKSMSCARPGGVYIAAFMEQSAGYFVDHIHFPAYATNAQELQHIFEPLCANLRVKRIQKAENPLREGYSGMVLVTGCRRKTL